MRKKNLFVALIVMFILTCQSAFSKTIDVQTAKKIAVTFYTYNTTVSNRSAITADLIYTRTESDNTVDYYVFNISPKGFVIVSADDNAEPVLAFSDESFFEPVPNSGIKDWLDDVANNMSYIIKNNLPAGTEISAKWSAYINGQNPVSSRAADSSITPLLSTTWNQSPYYNEYCPGGSVTGCVATAMAQIMKYWNYPKTGTGSYSYSDPPYGTLSANFDSTFAWSSMPNNVTGSSTTTQQHAVASLMSMVGISVAMEYSPSGSGSWVLQSDDPGGPCAQYSYYAYFGYNPTTILGVRKSAYTNSKWNIMILKDLNRGRPIQYEGFGSDGGHTWVLDGYSSSAMAHMNWGWGGLDNGYFKITNLNPSGIPLGGNDGALFGIEPLTTKAGLDPNNLDAKNNNQNLSQLNLTSTPTTGTGIESFNIYPIPAASSLTVKYSGSIFSIATIIVSNTLGQTVATYSSVNLNTDFPIDVSNYSKGLYFISVVSSNGTDRKVLKFLKD